MICVLHYIAKADTINVKWWDSWCFFTLPRQYSSHSLKKLTVWDEFGPENHFSSYFALNNGVTSKIVLINSLQQEE